MKRAIYILLGLQFVIYGSCNRASQSGSIENKAAKTSDRVFTSSEINKQVIEIRLNRTMKLSEQNLSERIRFLNQILKEQGFSQKNINVRCDQSISSEDFLCYGYTLENPKFSRLLACSMENYAMMYRVFDGEIRFMRMTEENIKAYPTTDRPDPAK